MTSLTEFFNKHEDDTLKGISHKNSIIKRNIIAHMAVNGECTLSELTKELHLDWGHSQRSLVKLVEDGFLTREKLGRSYRLRLTSQGEQAFMVCHRVFADWDAEALSGLTAPERQQLLALLQKAAKKKA